MARRVLPSRLELKRREGSCRAAPRAKVIFTTLLYVSPVQINPLCDHTGTPLHFHSSTTSGSASLIRARSRLSICPRQSPSSLILASISWEGDWLFVGSLFMPACPPKSKASIDGLHHRSGCTRICDLRQRDGAFERCSMRREQITLDRLDDAAERRRRLPPAACYLTETKIAPTINQSVVSTKMPHSSPGAARLPEMSEARRLC